MGLAESDSIDEKAERSVIFSPSLLTIQINYCCYHENFLYGVWVGNRSFFFYSCRYWFLVGLFSMLSMLGERGRNGRMDGSILCFNNESLLPCQLLPLDNFSFLLTLV